MTGVPRDRSQRPLEAVRRRRRRAGPVVRSSRPVRCAACSGRTAPARPRPCAWSSASSGRMPALLRPLGERMCLEAQRKACCGGSGCSSRSRRSSFPTLSGMRNLQLHWAAGGDPWPPVRARRGARSREPRQGHRPQGQGLLARHASAARDRWCRDAPARSFSSSTSRPTGWIPAGDPAHALGARGAIVARERR